VPEAVKNERIQTLARLQEDISLEKNQAWVGREVDVVLEGNGDGISIGRSYRDAPEIDGLVFLNTIIEPGQMVRAKITGAMVHDLIGVIS
jgi:ribosomal protein S12 methylthiotransferase